MASFRAKGSVFCNWLNLCRKAAEPATASLTALLSVRFFSRFETFGYSLLFTDFRKEAFWYQNFHRGLAFLFSCPGACSPVELAMVTRVAGELALPVLPLVCWVVALQGRDTSPPPNLLPFMAGRRARPGVLRLRRVGKLAMPLSR